MYFKTVLGRKISDSLLLSSDGSLFALFQSEGYDTNALGYWLIMPHNNLYKVVKMYRISQ